MKAVIMAGGKGTRLKPYTTSIPKPLVPVGEKAIIEILLHSLKKHGVGEVFICLNHFARMIEAFLGNGERFGLKISYSLEDRPLSTVAPLKLIRDLPDDFLVMNGDLLTDLDFAGLYQFHQKGSSLLTVATYSRTSKIDFGVIDIDPATGTASGFREKPEFRFDVSMGVYAMNKKILDLIPENEPFGFDHLMMKLLKSHQPIAVFPYHGYWLDIGRPEDYDKANEDIQKMEGLK
jgi:NDP-sugar pyrophosphorylase family protein